MTGNLQQVIKLGSRSNRQTENTKIRMKYWYMNTTTAKRKEEVDKLQKYENEVNLFIYKSTI